MAFSRPSAYPNPPKFVNIKDAEEYANRLYRALVENDRAGEQMRDRAPSADLKALIVRPEWYGAKRDGASDDSTKIQAAVVAASASGGTVLFAPGSYAVNTTADWSSYTNVTFCILPGATLKIPAGVTITIPNLSESGIHQRFDCASATARVFFRIGGVKEILPDWWKANTTPKTTDMTVAVQAAVSACLHNTTISIPLRVVSMYLLTASVNIDIAINGPPYSYFKIVSDQGGGFYVNAAIEMFSTTLDLLPSYSVSSNFIIFDGIVFDSSDGTLAAYIVNSRLFRIQSSACSFIRIKFNNVPEGTYTQSLHFFNNNIRRWTGSFFKGLGTNYDIRFSGNTIEDSRGAADYLIEAGYLASFNFTNNLAEGITGAPIYYSTIYGGEICGNYFELNGLELKNFVDPVGANAILGVKFSGNHIWRETGNTTYSVQWPATSIRSLVSESNFSSGYLHDIPANILETWMSINDYAVGATSNNPLVSVYTPTASVVITDGGTVGQAAGPLLNFDDTNNHLGITGGTVGIGTTDPIGSLAVVGSSAGDDGGNGYGGIVQITTGSGGQLDEKLEIGILDGSYTWLQAIKAGTDYRKIVINPLGGNVGIGDVAPAEKLDVAGNINVTGVYKVDDTQVLGPQAAAQANLKADYTTGDLDTEAEIIAAINATNAGINTLLAKLRTHGTIAT